MTVYNRVNKINELVREDLLKEREINENLLIKEREKKSLEILKDRIKNLEYALEQQLIINKEIKKEREMDIIKAEQKELHKRQVEAWKITENAKLYQHIYRQQEIEEDDKWRYRWPQ